MGAHAATASLMRCSFIARTRLRVWPGDHSHAAQRERERVGRGSRECGDLCVGHDRSAKHKLPVVGLALTLCPKARCYWGAVGVETADGLCWMESTSLQPSYRAPLTVEQAEEPTHRALAHRQLVHPLGKQHRRKVGILRGLCQRGKQVALRDLSPNHRHTPPPTPTIAQPTVQATVMGSSRAAALTRCFAMGGDEELELPKLNQPPPDDDAESAAFASSSITWNTHSNALGGKPAGRPATHPPSQPAPEHISTPLVVCTLTPPTNSTGVRRPWAGREAPAQTKGRPGRLSVGRSDCQLSGAIVS
eukprot:COSAG01_NODE_1247_length_11073_cov_23.273465_7_plen_305_part_00